MIKMTIAAATAFTIAGAATTYAAALPRSPLVAKAGNGLVEHVDRRKVCEWRHGEKHCWWVGHRDWDDHRWKRWQRDHWRKGWFYLDGPGLSINVR